MRMAMLAGAGWATVLAGSAAAQEAIDPATLSGAQVLVYELPGTLKPTKTGSSFVSRGRGSKDDIKVRRCVLGREDAIALHGLLGRAGPVTMKVDGVAATWGVDFQRPGEKPVFASISRGSLLGHDPRGWAIIVAGKPGLLAPAEQEAVTAMMIRAGCAAPESRK